jgi:hypothetical protein
MLFDKKHYETSNLETDHFNLHITIPKKTEIFDLTLTVYDNKLNKNVVIVPSHFYLIWDVNYSAIRPKVIYEERETGERKEIVIKKDWSIAVENETKTISIKSTPELFSFVRYGTELAACQQVDEELIAVTFMYGYSEYGSGSITKITHSSYLS